MSSLGAAYAQNDQILQKSFVKTELLDEVLERRVLIVSGPKGAGKSALPIILKADVLTREKVAFIEVADLVDLPWLQLIPEKIQEKPQVVRQQWMRTQWSFIFLLQLMYRIWQRPDEYVIEQEETRAYYKKVLVDSGLIESDNLGQPKISFSDMVARVTHIDVAGWFGVDLNRESLENNERVIKAQAEKLRKLLVKTPLKPQPHLFFLDEFDFADDPDPTYQELIDDVIGTTITASLDISEYFQRTGDHDVRFISLMREDILDRIEFPRKAAIVADRLCSFSWNGDFRPTSLTSNWSLRNLIEKRFSISVGSGVSWEDVFEDAEKAFSYIIDRTMLRPRDIIVYCDLVLARHGERPTKYNKIKLKSVREAEAEYSGKLLKELLAEMKPVIKTSQLKQILKSMPSNKIMFDQFEKNCLESEVPGSEIFRILESLFERGALRYTITGGDGGGSKIVSRINDPSAPFAKRPSYELHSGLLKSLGLKAER